MANSRDTERGTWTDNLEGIALDVFGFTETGGKD
jgi:hypothetical protein